MRAGHVENYYRSETGQKTLAAMEKIGLNVKHQDGKLYTTHRQEVGSILEEARLIRDAQKSKHASQKTGGQTAYVLPQNIDQAIDDKLIAYGMQPGVNCTMGQFENKRREVVRELYSRFSCV